MHICMLLVKRETVGAKTGLQEARWVSEAELQKPISDVERVLIAVLVRTFLYIYDAF